MQVTGSLNRSPVNLDTLRHHLERAMASYYHGQDLAHNPLFRLLLPSCDQVVREPSRLRALLRDALESIRPSPHLAADDPAWLPYRVATLHYVQSQPRGVVCEELAISQATFYRHRREALDAMADYFWRHRAGTSLETQPEASHHAALDRAVSAVSGRYREPLDLSELARGVQAIVERMPGAHETALVIETDTPSQPVYGDPTLIRQVILNLLTDALECGRVVPLYLRLVAKDGTILGEIAPYAPQTGSGIDVARQLLEAVGGHLQLQADPPRAMFGFPPSLPPLVLCLDDDADAARLYQIYLGGKGVRLNGVTTGDALRAAIAEEMPSAILLDVLMPREDGWAILEELQQDERLSRVPVVICSVLQQPDLALAMGATAVLTKPVTPEALTQTLEAVLGARSLAQPAP